jgi:hypothetical protein
MLATMPPRIVIVIFFGAYAKLPPIPARATPCLSSICGGGLMAKFPDNARLGLTLYFKSPSLGQIMFIDVDASPEHGGEVELLPEGIAELTTRWCGALNRMRKVKNFRPATRAEVLAYMERHDSVGERRTTANSARRSTSAASAPRTASASGVRYRLRELGGRYLGSRSERWLHCDRDRGPDCQNGSECQNENEFCPWSRVAMGGGSRVHEQRLLLQRDASTAALLDEAIRLHSRRR